MNNIDINLKINNIWLKIKEIIQKDIRYLKVNQKLVNKSVMFQLI